MYTSLCDRATCASPCGYAWTETADKRSDPTLEAALTAPANGKHRGLRDRWRWRRKNKARHNKPERANISNDERPARAFHVMIGPARAARALPLLLLLALLASDGTTAQRGAARRMMGDDGATDGPNIYESPCDPHGAETAAAGALNYWWLRTSSFLLSLG
jgi:hypothetical protein